MMKYELIPEDDKRLRTIVHNKHKITKNTEDLVYNMIMVMKKHDGIGLAAPQLGVMERIFVIGHESTGYVVCINPSWERTQTAKLELFQEGCLSFPHLEMQVERFNEVHCTFTNLKGETDTRLFTGVWAQAVQHETDHLDGMTFDKRVKTSVWQKANALRREKIKNLQAHTQNEN